MGQVLMVMQAVIIIGGGTLVLGLMSVGNPLLSMSANVLTDCQIGGASDWGLGALEAAGRCIKAWWLAYLIRRRKEITGVLSSHQVKMGR